MPNAACERAETERSEVGALSRIRSGDTAEEARRLANGSRVSKRGEEPCAVNEVDAQSERRRSERSAYNRSDFKMIVVLGASGLLGAQIVKLLLSRKDLARIVTHGSADWHDFPIVKYRQSGIDVILGDILHDEVRTKAFQDCQILIYVSSSIKHTVQTDLSESQVVLVQKLVKDVGDFGIKRYIHVSCLAATENSIGKHFRSKWEAEKLVRQSSCSWTIFRPSFMFGDRFPLLDLARPLVTFKPFLPVIGSGVNRIQPVSYENVADCILQSVYNQTMIHKSYDLAGPEIYTMTELLQLAREALRLKGPVVNLPVKPVESALLLAKKALPVLTITPELAHCLIVSAVAENNQMMNNFIVQPSLLKEALPKIISSY